MTLRQSLAFPTLALLIMLIAVPASAHHVVWLDFSELDLSAFRTVNGNTPPTAGDLARVEDLIVAKVVEDYAQFDIQVTTMMPANGRFTRVRFKSTSGDGFGCSGATCCPAGGTCTGIGSWNRRVVSGCEVYAGNFAATPAFSGDDATTATLGNGMGHVASHELGHILGLEHCHAFDDSFALGCSGIQTRSRDENVLWHIMSAGAVWDGAGIPLLATRDLVFSVHASRRKLAGQIQLRDHFHPLRDLNADGRADLVHGRIDSPWSVSWCGNLSNGRRFDDCTIWSEDAGIASDRFLTGDVDGDHRADLVYGRTVNSTQVRWYVRRSDGRRFLSPELWRNDGGDVGDIFRLADVTGDGRDDLVYGRPVAADTVQWFVRASTGTRFGEVSVWREDAGNIGDIFFLGDIDIDGDADLVYAREAGAVVTWWVRRSSGTAFGDLETWSGDFGNAGDLFYLADTGGDGDADLLVGHVRDDFDVTFSYRPAEGRRFGPSVSWGDSGSAGDLFRFGDGNGDGFLDIFLGRSIGLAHLTGTPDPTRRYWLGGLSLGGSFAARTAWALDAGDDEDIFP